MRYQRKRKTNGLLTQAGISDPREKKLKEGHISRFPIGGQLEEEGRGGREEDNNAPEGVSRFRDLSSVQLGFFVGFTVVHSSSALILQFIKVVLFTLQAQLRTRHPI
ncbi:transmembrane protein, putative [Medicago truncatula]|uniref:Transmembrane protein, putative n=1 Tax=Medicago truncatula TaxID=3880 RepID=A0A072TFT5_MEDTR|nr:transmembrane protein, putative [Medicago truncatula]